MLDDQLSVLSNVHRRHTLLALLEENPEDDRTIASGGSDPGEGQQTIAMEHVHLPQLEDHGYINRNREENSVTKGAQFDEIKPLLAILKGIEDEKSKVRSLD
jgi:hypothetical protein